MELQDRTDSQYQTYDNREYTIQEIQRLLGELEEFRKTKLYELYTSSLLGEIADFTDLLVEDDTLNNDRSNVMKGEIRSMKRLLIRFEDMIEFLLAVEKEKTNQTEEDNE